MTVLADIPNPINIVTDAFGAVGGWAFDKVAEGIASWILGAVEFFVSGAIDFLRSSSSPDVTAAWFSGSGSPYAVVRNIAGLLLVGFVLLGVIQGLVNGDVAGMIRRMAGNLPAAVAGMVVTTAVVSQLLQLTDAMSQAVLVNTDEQALHFLSGFGVTVSTATSGFAAVILGLVAVVAGLLLWIELIVRASLVYVLVAVSPLGFAATLWPSAKGVLRKTIELLLAVIISKLVICITLAIGVAALSGAGTAGTSGAGLASNAGDSIGALLVGAVLLGLAAFSPFIVLKLVPVAEAALVAQGVSRGPLRATQAGMSAASSVSMVRRLSGGTGGPGAPGASGTAGVPGQAGAPGSAPGATAAGRAGGGTAVAGSAPAAGGTAATAGGTAAAGAAAGPPGVAVAAGVSAVAAGASAARKVADTAKSTAGGAAGSTATANAPRGDGTEK